MSEKPADGTPALRAMLLSAKPSDFGLVPNTELPRVWAALMEMRIGKAGVSLVAVADGTTSLYFSTGGGFIGGGEHESVRAANRKLLIAAEQLPRVRRAKGSSRGGRRCGLVRCLDV